MFIKGLKRAAHENSDASSKPIVNKRDQKILEEQEELFKIYTAENINTDDLELEVVSVFPGQQATVLPIDSQTAELYNFGFLSDWAKTKKDFKNTFNARNETLLEKPTWKKAIQNKQRCLIPAAAFFETNKATKKRYRIAATKNPVNFYAGIFNHFTDKETSETIKTFAIITCSANALVNTIHDRMPVILNHEGQKIWMDKNASESELKNLFKPYPSDEMNMVETPLAVPSKKTDQLTLDF
jgi:putative SOS response-associated peptidase YedK